MPDEKGVNAICENCGETFHKDEQGSGSEEQYCSRCMIKLAEEYIPEKTDLSKLKRVTESRIVRALLWIILFICISVIAIQVPKLISAFTKEEKPIRYGTYSTDTQADQCIKNLWRISKLLQEGKLPGKDIACPVSQKPYTVVIMEDDSIVRCPNPELHGLKEIRISKKVPRPEVKQ